MIDYYGLQISTNLFWLPWFAASNWKQTIRSESFKIWQTL